MQDSGELGVAGQTDVCDGLVETGDCSTVHLVMRAVAAVHADYRGLVPEGVGVTVRASERLRPVSGEALAVIGMEAMAEGVADHFVGHHPVMPRIRKT